MFCIELHNGIHKLIEGFNRLGLWHRGDEATIKETSIKIFYSIYYLFFPISLIAGAIASDNKEDSLFLTEISLIGINICVRMFYILWRKKEICVFLNRIGVYSIKGKDDFTVVDKKLNIFMKWIIYFYFYAFFVAVCISVITPLIGSEKKLFLNVGFPLDYKNNDFAYWMAFGFVFTEIFLAAVSISFSIIIWYLLFNCCLKYDVLGSELENMGVIRSVDPTVNKLKISEREKRNLFNRDLITGIKSHKDINE